MRILLSAFACGPNVGSEEGVGWNWAVEAARHGHRVVCLTQTDLRAAIEAEIARGGLPDTLEFAFFMPRWLEWIWRRGQAVGLGKLTHHLTHLLWQILVVGHLRARFPDLPFDVVHHITYGGIRHPTLLGRLPVPLVLGPLGGGERAPWPLRRGYRWRALLYDLVRDLHTALIRFDPITRHACASALVTYVKTAELRAVLPARHRPKVAVHMEIGIHEVDPEPHPPQAAGEPLRLIYAGRFLYWKGMHLGLEGLAEARRRGVEVCLTMLGRGPDEGHWRGCATRLGLDPVVEWVSWVPHDRMAAVLRRHHAMLFPSLHNSSGNVVLEALSRGLPVICLDLGGPAVLTDASCGRVVATAGRDRAACAAALADAIGELAADRRLLARLSQGALVRARQHLWPQVVQGLYADVARRLAEPASDPEAERIALGADGSV